jgi:hypothetical protein
LKFFDLIFENQINFFLKKIALRFKPNVASFHQPQSVVGRVGAREILSDQRFYPVG